MSVIYILLGVSIPLALAFLIVFLYMSGKGQFDDCYTPSIRMLTDGFTKDATTEITPIIEPEPKQL
jgi:cbb3-type cytochrome oxidase maturation protein